MLLKDSKWPKADCSKTSFLGAQSLGSKLDHWSTQMPASDSQIRGIGPGSLMSIGDAFRIGVYPWLCELIILVGPVA